jgi:hypothetical protein
MQNYKLYVHPKPVTKRNYTPKASFPKAKHSDVPPMYRRNRKQDALNIALVIASGLALLNCILFFVNI